MGLLANISEVLGTTWWTVVCVMVGFGAGLLLKNKIMNMLGR